MGKHRNKYEAESRRAARERRERVCRSKVRYADRDSAEQKGQRCYRCACCGGWHRSGSLVGLVKGDRRYGKGERWARGPRRTSSAEPW